MIIRSLFFALVLLNCANAMAAKQAINIYIYHLKPPYVDDLDTKSGLYFQFSDYLNNISDSPFEFKVQYLPRKRLDRFLQEGKIDGLVLGVKPSWFQDSFETKYYWTPPVFADRDEVISLAESPVEYEGPLSLVGKSIGGVRGYKYHTIDQLVKDKRAYRVDAASESDVIDLVLKKRVDVAILSRSSLNILANLAHVESQIHTSKIPHDQYFRRLLVPLEYRSLFEFLNKHMHSQAFVAEWQQVHLIH